MSAVMVAVWAAADVNLTQVCAELAQLEGQVNTMNAEFTRIKDGQMNVGLDGKLEDAKGPATHPLHRRLSRFLNAAKPRIAQVRQQAKEANAALGNTMAMFGETPSTEQDANKAFFGTLASFARAYRQSLDEIDARRLAADKAQRAEEEATARAA
eukprot:CAMPEP_0173298848 /NCGR_PEP_ID=MMETSP1143-20121109/16327_1 /TAXON_ID=483371 /ORGANISM="non described non described, Strain CCMP2298" /LENGTH=154 /DNA_ID=CAMNT_0014239023 /DNA_START=5 /DNA_END=466 /DNA_ORIENTATION=-